MGDVVRLVHKMHFDGPCPFLTCFEAEPHDHPLCPECTAVRFGNLSCPTCREHLRLELSRRRALHMNSEHGRGLGATGDPAQEVPRKV